MPAHLPTSLTAGGLSPHSIHVPTRPNIQRIARNVTNSLKVQAKRMSHFIAFHCISSHFIAISRMSITASVKLYENREWSFIGIRPISSKKKKIDSLESVATNCNELG